MHPHRALLIVDVQQAFAPPADFIRRLERYARRFPCRIFTRFINPPGSMFRRVLKQKCCAPDTADTALLLTPQKEDLVFDKLGRYGLEPRQVRALRARRITKVTVCGLDTDACVLGVMFSLFDHGIECHLKESMCWSSSGLHRAACQIIRAQFREVR
ncbi:MAG TPA: isochorismatase family cysteine hydrolase [Lacunisphaera sp.]|nr:isochorismatase family cysteine hydrolase [Lacunisphaera sp.]